MNAITDISPVTALVSDVSPKIQRDGYGAIGWSRVPEPVKKLVGQILKEIEFTPGKRGINRGKGYVALNFEVYGWDLSRQLVALQLRQTSLWKQGWWTEQQKIYVLAGLDEGDQLFSHAIPTSYQRMSGLADADPIDVVRWAESKIFRVPVARLHTIIRQGDVALVPVRSIPARAGIVDDKKSFTLRESHHVLVDGVAYEDADSRRWVIGKVRIEHIPGQHRPIEAEGKFEVVCGRRQDIDFNTPD